MAINTKHPLAIISLALSGTLGLGFAQIALAETAQDKSAGTQISAAQANPNSVTKTTGTTGSDPAAVVATMKSEQQQLRRMGEAIKRTRRAGLDLIGECTQPIEMMGEIDIIGQDVIPIMPATAEGFGNQYNPPRPRYINLHMTQLGALIPILQDDVDGLLVPDSEKDFAAQPLKDLKGYMGDLSAHYKKLQDLTKTSDYDQMALTNEARGVDASCKGIDEARKKLLHEDAKAEKKEEKLEEQDRKKKH